MGVDKVTEWEGNLPTPATKDERCASCVGKELAVYVQVAQWSAYN